MSRIVAATKRRWERYRAIKAAEERNAALAPRKATAKKATDGSVTLFAAGRLLDRALRTSDLE
jgi:hypothetical protein